MDIEFIKVDNYNYYLCKDSEWKLSKDLGFHNCSASHNYIARWFNNNNVWSLYLTNYEDIDFKNGFDKLIITVDTVYDVFRYMAANKGILII